MGYRPYAVSWNLTQRCNLVCAHCYLSAAPGASADGELDTAACRRVMADIARVSPGTFLILTGGEPLLRPDIFGLAAAGRDHGFTVVLGTNGVLLRERQARSMRAHGVQGASLSLDSTDPGRHDRFRRLPGAWQGAVRATEHLRAEGLDFSLHMSVTDWNVDEIAGMIDLVKIVMRQGWRCVRLVPPDEPDGGSPAIFEPRDSLTRMADWAIAVRQAAGRNAVLGVEYHHRLSVPEAASFCQRMPDGTLDFLEEPIRDETPDAYASLRTLTAVPFAIGEEFASKWQFLPYIERGLTQYARLDICNVGGFTEAVKVAGWCEAHYIDLMPHNPLGPVCTAATVHLAAAVPNFAWLECRETAGDDTGRHVSPIFLNRPTLDRTTYPVPTAPGLGVDIDERALPDPSEFKFTELPRFRRADRSHTNW